MPQRKGTQLCESVVNAKPLHPYCSYAWICPTKHTLQNHADGVKEDLSPKDTSLQQKLKGILVKAAEMRADVTGRVYIKYVSLFTCI